jgi:hypothetical protein
MKLFSAMTMIEYPQVVHPAIKAQVAALPGARNLGQLSRNDRLRSIRDLSI